MYAILVLGLAAASSLAAITEAEADKLFQSQQWPESAAAYRQLATEDPSRGSHWFRLGMSLQSLRQSEDSLAAYTKARALRYKPAALYIRAAILLTQAKQYAQAIDWLRELIETGFAAKALDGIAPLAELRNTDAYRALQSSQPEPCSTPQCRQLDFWAGHFEVRNPQGQLTGHNRIEKILNGCVLQENWTEESWDAGNPAPSGLTACMPQLTQRSKR